MVSPLSPFLSSSCCDNSSLLGLGDLDYSSQCLTSKMDLDAGCAVCDDLSIPRQSTQCSMNETGGQRRRLR